MVEGKFSLGKILDRVSPDVVAVYLKEKLRLTNFLTDDGKQFCLQLIGQSGTDRYQVFTSLSQSQSNKKCWTPGVTNFDHQRPQTHQRPKTFRSYLEYIYLVKVLNTF